MTLLYIRQVQLYLGWESPEFDGWWVDRSEEEGFRCHLGRLLLVVG